MLQYFYKTFIFSCGWSQSYILLFYFDLEEFDAKIIVKILWNLLCQYNNIYANSYKYSFFFKSTNWWLEKKKRKSQWSDKQYILSKLKSIVAFTQSHTTFSQKIYFQTLLIIVSYFIILFWPIRNWHLNNYENIVKFVMSI